MAKTFQNARQYPQWFIRRNFVENPIGSATFKVPKIDPRVKYRVRFDLTQDVVFSTRTIPRDLRLIETTDIVPSTVRKQLYIDIGVLVIFEPVPSGSFRCEVFNEAFYIPYELNETTFDYEPINILGERIAPTQEEIDFMGGNSADYGSLKKYGSFQESQQLLLHSQSAATEDNNVINTQISKRRYQPIDFQQNFISLEIQHTADRALQLKQANLTLSITEVNL